MTLNAGASLLADADDYVEPRDISIADVFGRPHVVTMTRQLADQRIGSWASAFFAYTPPRFGFRRSERRLLELAGAGGTNDELASRLGVRVSAVRKTWREGYQRVADCAPDLGLDESDDRQTGP